MNRFIKIVSLFLSFFLFTQASASQIVRCFFPCLFYQQEERVEEKISCVDAGAHTLASSAHKYNEDVIFIEELPHGGMFYGVFDGHGPLSHLFAKLVAKKLHFAVHTALVCQRSLSAELCKHLWVEVDKAVCSEFDKNSAGAYLAGTTALVVIVYKEKVVVLSTGDSQALLMKKDNNFFMTEPHDVLCEKSFARLFSQDSHHVIGISYYCLQQKMFVRTGLIDKLLVYSAQGEGQKQHVFTTQEQVLNYFNIKNVPQNHLLGRMSGYVNMSHSFGDICKKTNTKVTFSVEPNYNCFNQKDIAWIVLGSDGLWDVFQSQYILQQVKNMIEQNYSSAVIAQLLSTLARKHQKKDDIAVVVLLFKDKQG